MNASCISFALFLLFACPVAAQGASVLVCTMDETTHDDLASLLEKDICAMGYTVERRGDCNVETVSDIAALRASALFDAVIRLSAVPREVTIHVWNSETGQRLTRSMPLGSDDEQGVSQLSLGISELLRAAFVEILAAPRSERTTPDATPVVPSAHLRDTEKPVPSENSGSGTPTDVRRPAPLITLEFQGSASVLSFDYPPTAHLGIGGHVKLYRSIGMEVLLLAPLTALEIREDEGRVTIRKAAGAVGARLTLPVMSERVHLSVSAGVGLDVTFVDGHANGALQDSFTTTFAALPYGQLAIRVALTERFGLFGGVLVGTSIPRTRVEVLDRGIVVVSEVLFCGYLGVSVEIGKKPEPPTRGKPT